MTIMIPRGYENEDNFVDILMNGRSYRIPKGKEVEWPMKPKTNADRIRAMSDEDLAEWLVKKTVYQESAFSHPSYLNFMTGSDDTKESAIKGTVKWLKQPDEGE